MNDIDLPHERVHNIPKQYLVPLLTLVALNFMWVTSSPAHFLFLQRSGAVRGCGIAKGCLRPTNARSHAVLHAVHLTWSEVSKRSSPPCDFKLYLSPPLAASHPVSCASEFLLYYMWCRQAVKFSHIDSNHLRTDCHRR